MGRSRRFAMPIGANRSTLRHGLETASKRVFKLCDAVAHATTRMNYDAQTMAHWGWSDDVLRICRQARNVIEPRHWRNEYAFRGVSLSIDFGKTLFVTPTPVPTFTHPNATPFLDTVSQLKQIYEKFCVVDHCLRWLDGHATPGAMRYYWPTILSLTPECPDVQDAAVGRHAEPEGVAPHVPLFRDAANHVASALMIPAKDIPVDPDRIWVQIGGYDLHVYGVRVATPNHTFNLSPNGATASATVP